MIRRTAFVTTSTDGFAARAAATTTVVGTLCDRVTFLSTRKANQCLFIVTFRERRRRPFSCQARVFGFALGFGQLCLVCGRLCHLCLVGLALIGLLARKHLNVRKKRC